MEVKRTPSNPNDPKLLNIPSLKEFILDGSKPIEDGVKRYVGNFGGSHSSKNRIKVKDERRKLFRGIKEKVKTTRRLSNKNLELEDAKTSAKDSVLRRITKFSKQWNLVQTRTSVFTIVRNLVKDYRYFGIGGLKITPKSQFPIHEENQYEKWSFEPNTWLFSTHAILILFIFLYFLIFFPLFLAFEMESFPSYFIMFNKITVSYLIVDIIFQFFTVVEHHGEKIRDVRLLAKRYILSYFVIDVIASIPVEFVKTESEIFDTIFKILMIVRILRIANTVLNSRRLGNVYNRVLNDFKPSQKTIKVFETLFYALTILHLSSCLLILLGNFTKERSWTKQ